MTLRNRAATGAVARQSAFTLIEVVLVVAILGILLLLAAPSYRIFVLRAHRADAIAQLMQVAACQERVHASLGGYDPARCLPAASARYRFVYAEFEPGLNGYYLAAAMPIGQQAKDPCGAIQLDSLGRRSAAAETTRCWSAR